MGLRWIKTAYPGIRARVDDSKPGKPDPYFTIRYKIKGKLIEEKLGRASEGWTAKKAAAQLARLREAHTTGIGPQTLEEARQAQRKERESLALRLSRKSVESTLFCSAALDHFMPWARRNKISWDDDLGRLEKHVLPAIGNVPLRDLTREHVEKLLATAQHKGLAPATVQQCLALVRRVCNFASQVTLHGVPLFPGRNPCTGVVVRRPDNGRLRFLTREEAFKLIAAARGADTDMALHDMIVLSLNTGMRLGEIQLLRNPDVDLSHGIVHVLDRDGKPGGVVYLNKQSRPVLERRLAAPSHTALIIAPHAGGKVRGNISHQFKELADRLGLNDGIDDPRQRVVFHTLRHTFASWLALAGTDIYRIKELMRHKTITMTMRYAHLIPNAKRRAVEELPAPDDPD